LLAAKLIPQEKAFACLDTVKARVAHSLSKSNFLTRTKLFAAAMSLALSISNVALTPLMVSACNCSEVKVPATEPADINAKEGYKWSFTKERDTEFSDAIKKAKDFCIEYKKNHPKENLAIVSDIDETVLDNRECLKTFSKDHWDAFFLWIDEARAPKLKESADFLQWARDNGFFVFFITGRHEKDRGFTIVNLNHQGISYDGLFLRTPTDNRPAEIYKTEVREQIEKMGFKVVENIGDQFSDLAGGRSEDCQKLPNRMYFIE
jgi:predicted secreted acid phosphatase